MTSVNEQNLHDTSSAPAPRRPGRRLSGSKAALFALMALTLVVLVAAAALLAFQLRFVHDYFALRTILGRRRVSMTMANFPNVVTPERRDHLRACYKDPEKVDFSKISWDLFCRPTPFLNYAPEPGEQGEGHFNAQQLRNRQDVALPKPAGVYRIFVTGGSQAYSIGAPSQDETIPAYLERILNERGFAKGKRVEVFNAAICGHASTHERIFVENRASLWQPDLVVALSGGNDAHWAFEGTSVLDMRTSEDELYLAAMNAGMRWVGAKDFPWEPPVKAKGPLPVAEVAAQFVRNMRLAALALAPTGARLVVATQPTLSPAAKPLTEGERRWLEREEPPGKIDYVEQCFAAMAAALEAPGPNPPRHALDHNPENMKVAHVRDVFKERNDAIFFDLFHMADKGNELIARRLSDELEKIGPQ